LSKVKTIFYCSNCGTSSPKWIGKCPSCQEWNTYHEEVVTKATKQETKSSAWKSATDTGISVKPQRLSEVKAGKKQRIISQDIELNRVLSDRGGHLAVGVK